MSDDIVPFPSLITTIVALVGSFVLILESQNAEQQHEQVKHFMVMMTATTAGAKRTKEEVNDNKTGRENRKMTLVKLITLNVVDYVTVHVPAVHLCNCCFCSCSCGGFC